MVEPSTVAVGLLVGLGGVVLVTRAETVARLEEQWDAIGSVRTGPVEPARWKVRGNRAMGIVLALVGAMLTVGGLVR
ncbi:hypothetical protein [Halomarina oriensis]|uniref:DUF6199 domain-containing protein n=1 Tax=Halomarina oriensis TaxID=671145 RepID=A0A6B0GF62_9EURY|nr:hypothetical protein [Halomarina oriensis]MWG33596.1 hypothetical protein [Halomarina oriensis]